LQLISEISINHSIGDNVRKLFNKYIFLHQPERDYYIIRNFYYIFRLNYIDKKYKLLELVKTLMRTILYIAYSNNKIKHAKYIVKGHVDGLKKDTVVEYKNLIILCLSMMLVIFNAINIIFTNKIKINQIDFYALLLVYVATYIFYQEMYLQIMMVMTNILITYKQGVIFTTSH